MKWHFFPLPASGVQQDVTQRDQFDNDDVALEETLVREVVQNSLDAAINDKDPVIVTFDWITEEDGLEREFFESLFHEQKDQAEKSNIDLSKINFNKPRVLAIEDFNTSGLTGNLSKRDDENFSSFWRNHGKSNKKGKDKGRWGLGKLVYSLSSQIGVFFGLTVRPQNDGRHLMGQSVLNLRTIDGKEYPPHAFFSDLENEDNFETRFEVPIKDNDLIEKFVDNFSSKRENLSGLSIFIAFPDEDFEINRMIAFAIGNYFYPIITKQLILKFGKINITDENIRELAKKYEKSMNFSQIDILFDFIEEASESEKKAADVELRDTWINDDRLDENDFEKYDLEKIKNKFYDHKLVSLSLPVHIKKKNGEKVDSHFSTYIKKPRDLKEGKDLYVRGGLTLPGEEKFKEFNRVALGAMIADDEAIQEFLGYAENAAHTKWQANTEKLKINYQNPKKIVDAVKKSLVQLYALLKEIEEDKDKEALKDYFWILEASKKMKKRKKEKKESGGSFDEKIESNKPNYKITKVNDGFKISNSDGLTNDKLPKSLRIQVAYEIDKGNAFKKYSEHDFKVGRNGTIDHKVSNGAKVLSCKDNEWDIEIQSIPFTFEANGFDENLDLKIRTS